MNRTSVNSHTISSGVKKKGGVTFAPSGRVGAVLDVIQKKRNFLLLLLCHSQYCIYLLMCIVSRYLTCMQNVIQHPYHAQDENAHARIDLKKETEYGILPNRKGFHILSILLNRRNNLEAPNVSTNVGKTINIR